MRVLLTNNALDVRAGSELYVRDLALELLRRGHHPVAYSTRLGQVASELRDATVPVISKLECLGEPPDIIHGHHHYETLSAMLHFPQTPAISYCHGWLPWEEAPLRFPRILRYVAVDDVCRERLIAEGGIEPRKVRVLLNFFDAALFPPRSPLPRKPLTAIAFSNLFSETSDLPVLREACRRHGIQLHAAGIAAGNAESNTGALLARFDIVFAKARAAIEAMAVGAAVILCNPGRLGPLVTTKNFQALQRFNFGIRTLDRALDVDALTSQLHEFDNSDAAAVSELVRETCELRPAVDRIISLYEEVLAEARHSPVNVSIEGDRAVTRYLEESAPRYKKSELEIDRERWAKRCLAAESALANSAAELEQVKADRSRWAEPYFNRTEPVPAAPQARPPVSSGDRDLLVSTQFHLLTALGLRDYHFTLEIGCGPLSAASLLIPYLLPERYCTIEPHQQRIEETIRLELGHDQITIKQPRFVTDSGFRLTESRNKFDYILARSLFSYATVPQINQCLAEAAACLQTDGVLAASGKPEAGASFCEMAFAAGLHCKVIDWPDPTGEIWALFYLPSASVPEDPTYYFERLPLANLSEILVIHERNPGFLESILDTGDSLIVTGWAVHPITLHAATYVLFANSEGRVVSAVRPRIPRHDVALNHGEWALRSGFRARIDKETVSRETLVCLSFSTGDAEAFSFSNFVIPFDNKIK